MANYYHGGDIAVPSTPTNTPYQLTQIISESLYSEGYTNSDYVYQQLPCYGASPGQDSISHPLRHPLRLPMPTFPQQPYTDPGGVLFNWPLLKRLFLKWGFLERPFINKPFFGQTFFRAPFSKVPFLRATVFKELFPKGLFSRAWLRGVIVCAFATAVVLFLNTSFTIFATREYDIESGLGTIYKGSCSKSKKMAFWAHICINALSTVLLGASNYCMQCVVAPTRSEVNNAHEKGLWMDIGASSVRNLRSIKWCRVALWGFLGISSAPLHLLYNSAVFESLSTNQYQVLIAPENSPELPLLIKEAQGNYNRSSGSLGYKNLTAMDCANAYSVRYLTDRRDVIVVVGADQNITSIQNLTGGLGYLDQGTSYNIQDWMCSEDACMVSASNPIDSNNWNISGQLVQYCVSEMWQENCSLQFSTDIMIVVIICNAVKCICMILVVVDSKEPALITLGDAISSFLRIPDKQTAGMCLVGKCEIRRDNRKGIHEGFFQGPPYQKWHPHNVYWFRAASAATWKICIVASVLPMVTALYLLSKGFEFLNDFPMPLDLSIFWNMGFGTPDPRTQIYFSDAYYEQGIRGIWPSIITANSTQLALSILYLLYNSLFTSMLRSNEWDQLSYDRKTLRVTQPTGKQRSTYFLSLPYKYSLPLMATWGMMHWSVSQSIFLFRVIEYNEEGKPTINSISGMGYSPIAILCAVSLGYIMLLVLIINGFRRYRGDIPLVGSCSAAISAACHPLPHMKPADILSELQWGAVAVGGGVECCTINGSVLTPIRGKAYASAAEAEESRSAPGI